MVSYSCSSCGCAHRFIRRGGKNLPNIAALSTTFLQLFLLFFFSVDSQGFIAEDFFSIASNKRGKQRANNHFQADRQRIKRENHQGEARRESRHLRNLFTHSKNNHQHTLITWQATDVISALTTSVSCTDFKQLFQNMSSK
jgi:hypothetical protein